MEPSDSIDLKERSACRSVALLNFDAEQLAWWQARRRVAETRSRKDGHICAIRIL